MSLWFRDGSLHLFAAALLVVTAFPNATFAEFLGPGAMAAISVEAAKGLPAESRVILEGHIVDELDPGFFRFRDASGAMKIEIDEEIWRGRPVDPGDQVRIHGAVDQSRLETEIDASHLEVMSAGD